MSMTRTGLRSAWSMSWSLTPCLRALGRISGTRKQVTLPRNAMQVTLSRTGMRPDHRLPADQARGVVPAAGELADRLAGVRVAWQVGQIPPVVLAFVDSAGERVMTRGPMTPVVQCASLRYAHWTLDLLDLDLTGPVGPCLVRRTTAASAATTRSPISTAEFSSAPTVTRVSPGERKRCPQRQLTWRRAWGWPPPGEFWRISGARTAGGPSLMTRNGPLTWVGVAGFEPAASSSRTKRAAKLRYTPATA
jgi:hypothetical protein